MISAPKDIYGINVFKIFVHELGGPKRVSKMLDVTERSVRRWLSEEKVPKAAVLALYWETQYGRSLIDTDHHYEIVLLRGHIQLLEEQFARAQHVIAGLKLHSFGTANEPYFDERGEFNAHHSPTNLSNDVSNGNEHSATATQDKKNKPFLSAKDQARKADRLARLEATAHLSNAEYAAKALRRARWRETRQKNKAAA